MRNSAPMFIVVVLGLLIGWTAGRAQTSAPDFELIVTAPSGQTSVECVRGCNLKWVERGNSANSGLMTKFTFACGASECSSGRIGGWLRK